MATITASGIGSNLDVNGIVTQLMTVERLPLDALKAKQESYDTKLSAYSTIKGALSTFQTSAFSLSSSSKFQIFKSSSSSTTVLSATTSSLASAGTYAIDVTQVAQSQRLVAAGQTSLVSSIGSGTLTFDFGSVTSTPVSQALQTAAQSDSDTTTFGGSGTNTLTFNFGEITGGTVSSGQYTGATFQSSSTQSFNFTGPLTLDGLESAINTADIGVTASVVEGTGAEAGTFRLQLVSDATGLASSMEISVASSNGDTSLGTLLAQDYEGTQSLFETVQAAEAGLNDAGQYAAGSATFTTTSTRTVTIDSGKTSLQDIRDAINEASIGIRAELINDGGSSPYRLVLSAENPGANNAFKISSDSASLQNFLGNDPEGVQNLSETASAQDATFSVNGLEITKSTNAVTDVIRGVTLNLKEVGTSTLSITLDNSGVSDSINKFVNAYNDLAALIKDASYVDLASGERGILTGEGTLTSVVNQIRGVMNLAFNKAGAAYSALPQIGISFKKDGTLEIDGAKLDAALSANYTAVTELFTYRRNADDPTETTTEGVAYRLDKAIGSMLDSGGLFTGRTDGINKLIKNLETRQDNLERRMEDIEARYRKQFSSLDALVGSMLQTSTFLTQQLAGLTSSS